MVLSRISDLSTVSPFDVLEIQATWAVLHSPDLQCRMCKEKTPSQEARDKRKGCAVEAPRVIGALGQGDRHAPTYELTRCPANFWDGYSQEIISMYRLFERGVLPFTGGVMDQPAKLIQVMAIIEGLDLKEKAEQQKRMASNAKRASRKGVRRGQ